MLPPMSRSATPHYRPEIDGLRAVAVLAVIACHAGFGVPGGFVGVDVFFVISGYLITSLLLRDLGRGTFHLGEFYLRRARRILPASIAVTLAVLVAGYLRLLPGDLITLGSTAVAHAACAANVWFYRNAVNYFGGAAEEMPLLHLWSLGVEEQFYFVFPLALWLCTRVPGVRSRVGLLSTLGTLAGLSLWAAIQGVYYEPPAAFFLPHTRAWELLIGAMLATLPAWGGRAWIRNSAAWIGLAGVVVPMAMYSSKTLFPGYAALPPCVGAALFIAAARGRQENDAAGFCQAWAGRLLATRGPVFVGQISYSLYLIHWPVLVFAGYWSLTPPTLLHRSMAVIASVALAVVSWRWIERPVRGRKVGRSPVTLLIGSAAGLAVIAGVGVWWARSTGLSGRFPPVVAKLDRARQTTLPLFPLRPNEVRRGRLAVIGDKRGGLSPSLLLWGDSHAAAVLPAVDAFCLAHGIQGRASIYPSRAPLLDYSADPRPAAAAQAVAYNREVLEFARREKIGTVLLVDYWSRDVEAGPAALDAALGRTIVALRGIGVRVYVMLQVPMYDVSVPKALAYEAIFGRSKTSWRLTADEQHVRQSAMSALAAKYAAADCVFLDPTPWFAGDDGTLRVTEAGRPFYLDAHHLTPFGAKSMIGPMLDRELVVGATPASPATHPAAGQATQASPLQKDGVTPPSAARRRRSPSRPG